jgi:hypothetical protein
MNIESLPPEVHSLLKRLAQAKKTHATRHYANQPAEIPGRLPYVCIGCLEWVENIRDGMKLRPTTRKITEDERRLVFAWLLPAARRTMAEAALNQAVTVQAYFPQAYEAGVNGPGGVIGVTPLGQADARASTALKMWLWQNEATHFPYTEDETEAAQQLWHMAEATCVLGLQWLRTQTQNGAIPAAHVGDIHTLLGVPALATLVEKNLGRRWQLRDLETIVLRP